MKYIGVLEPYFETGTEGLVWAIMEDGKDGYDALQVIDEGDHLKIFDEGGEVLFDDDIVCDRKAGWTEYPKNPGHGQPCALSYWIHWTQSGWKPDDWAMLFLRNMLKESEGKQPLRAELTKK